MGAGLGADDVRRTSYEDVGLDEEEVAELRKGAAERAAEKQRRRADRTLSRADVVQAITQEVRMLHAEALRYDSAAKPLIDEAKALRNAAHMIEQELVCDGDTATSARDTEAEERSSAPTPQPSEDTRQGAATASVQPSVPTGSQSRPASALSKQTASTHKSGASWALTFPVLGDDDDDNQALIEDWLQRQVDSHTVVLVSRQSCPFSAEARKIFSVEGVKSKELLVDELPGRGVALTEVLQDGCSLSKGPRYGLPVIWVNGTCIGALAELRQMAEKGLLETTRRKQAASPDEERNQTFVWDMEPVTGEAAGEQDEQRPPSGPPSGGRYVTAPPPPLTGVVKLSPALQGLPPRAPLLLAVSTPPPCLSADQTNLYEALGPRVLWRVCVRFARAAHSDVTLSPFYKCTTPRRTAVGYCTYLCERLGGPSSTGRRRVGRGRGANVLVCPLQLALRHRRMNIGSRQAAVWLQTMSAAMLSAGIGGAEGEVLAEFFEFTVWSVMHGWLSVADEQQPPASATESVPSTPLPH
eukprot:TRINITY_DN43175_c0_g1_i1.p1 TRINITY_DN43175_c0_g1~~TRINITY_DN43175_c0_g1_i1.p1  ORF type:complete len:545 (+),score=152.44 TRINITY_DN43175_c0_g1_i1:56-1636(+)